MLRLATCVVEDLNVYLMFFVCFIEKRFIYFYLMCMRFCLHMSGAYKGQKGMLDPLELELRKTVLDPLELE